MPDIRSLLEPGHRALARQALRLDEAIRDCGSRLREAVSSAVGETVASVVRETIQAVLALEPVSAPPERYIPPRRPPWMRTADRREDPWFADEREGDVDDEPPYDPPDEDDEYHPPARTADSSPARSRLPAALAVGLHTSLVWLRRHAGRFPVTTAVTVGLLTGLAMFAGGPLAGAAVGLASSAYNLLALGDAVRAGAAALATLGRR